MNQLKTTLEELQAAHKKAEEAGHATFKHKGQELVTDYVKYLIEYEKMKYKSRHDRKTKTP